MTMCLLTLY